MKKILFPLMIVVLLSCEGEPLVKDLDIDMGVPSSDVNGGKDVWLRPFLGFTERISTVEGTKFTYFCDTFPGPTTDVRSDNSSGALVITGGPLKSNTTYYWYCQASIDAQYTKGTSESEVYSFTTIDTSKIFDREWRAAYAMKYSDYKIYARKYQSLHKYDFLRTDEEVFGEIFSFDVTRDSVFNILYYGVFLDDIYPQKGTFEFAYDSVRILDRKFEFINFGRHDNESLELVLKIPGAEYVFIYKSTKK